MKRWQKIAGITSFALLILFSLLVSINAYLDMKYLVEPYALTTDNEIVWKMIGMFYSILASLSFVLFISILFSIILFICLWRKRK